ncbi:MAG: MFS transporter [Acidobacteria bacterium]|nr:MFS transporter [Acidobacteriota bacterium]
MDFKHKATKIELLNFSSTPMRTFHMAWLAFFLCFFGWFGIAPLMAVVREDLALTKEQVGNTIIASVAITVVARLFIGWLCDKIGPRIAYTWLLILGSIPVMTIGLADSYETFLLFRLAIGAIGASFVITQYHTSVMFAPNVVGTANATTAGWGNLGGGVTQMIMPALFGAVMTFVAEETLGWRVAMVFPGLALLGMGLLYGRVTKDSPDGNFADLRASGEMESSDKVSGAFWKACSDYRVWALFVVYGACFGIELTLNNIAALYFHDYFDLGLAAAGVVAGLFGLMNIFARTLGGVVGDRWGLRWGLRGRVWFLGMILFLEGIALMAFSQQTVLPAAIAMLIVFSLCVQMSEGATFSVVPFINKKALGAVAGIVGAGGNAGAVAAGFLFKTEALTWPQALLILGAIVTVCSGLAFVVRFSEADEQAVREEMQRRRKAPIAMPEARPARAYAREAVGG